MTIDILAGKQNRDGGWPYVRGASWTEPTVYSVLAMLAAGETERAGRGLKWILRTGRPDGGFAPHPGVEESTWVTALVALVPPERLGAAGHERAIRWLLATTGKESTAIYRLREWLLGNVRPAEDEFAGWPWFPDTAAWVTPTSFAILALRKAGKRDPRDEIRDRIQRGQEFLISRVCDDGGWNHGSTKALGYDAPSYPETTGLALLALDDLPPSRVARSVDRAERHLQATHALEAASWLRLGLLAHRRTVPPPPTCATRSRSTQELALAAILRRALDGADVFGAL